MSRDTYFNRDAKELQKEKDLRNTIERIKANLQKKWNIDMDNVKEKGQVIYKQQNKGWEEHEYIDIDYDDMSMCIGYLHRYSECHVALVLYETRQLHFVIEDLIKNWCKDNNSFKVVSVGGGPGTDILAFCKGSSDILQNYKQLQFHFTVIDLKSGWKEIFDEFMLAAKGQEDEDPNHSAPLFGLNATWDFVQADLRTDEIDQIGSADLILAVKALSIVSDDDKGRILQKIFASMKKGALFLFIDTFIDDVTRVVTWNSTIELLRKRGKFEIVLTPRQNSSIKGCTYDVYVLRKL